MGPGKVTAGDRKTFRKPGGKKPAKHFEVITEEDVAEVFGFGEYELPRAFAAKLLEEFTGAHRTSACRALRLNGRFARHLRTDGTMLTWR